MRLKTIFRTTQADRLLQLTAALRIGAASGQDSKNARNPYF
jgi:hypothetical protein